MVELYVLLVLMIIGAIIAIEVKDLLSSVIAVGAVGLALSIVFLILKAPDVAITQLVVEILDLPNDRSDFVDRVPAPLGRGTMARSTARCHSHLNSTTLPDLDLEIRRLGEQDHLRRELFIHYQMLPAHTLNIFLVNRCDDQQGNVLWQADFFQNLACK